MARMVRTDEVQGGDTVAIARWLLGRFLVTRAPDGGRRALRITETEAYDGPQDRACHASRGRTKRTEVMFQPGGVWYVYFIYGMHEMLNLVTGPRDYPAAVLIRGVEGCRGPGRVTRALAIDRRFNGRPARRASGLWLEDDGWAPADAQVSVTPRVGVAYAGPEWAAKPWRFSWQPERTRAATDGVQMPGTTGTLQPAAARAVATRTSQVRQRRDFRR